MDIQIDCVEIIFEWQEKHRSQTWHRCDSPSWFIRWRYSVLSAAESRRDWGHVWSVLFWVVGLFSFFFQGWGTRPPLCRCRRRSVMWPHLGSSCGQELHGQHVNGLREFLSCETAPGHHRLLRVKKGRDLVKIWIKKWPRTSEFTRRLLMAMCCLPPSPAHGNETIVP